MKKMKKLIKIIRKYVILLKTKILLLLKEKISFENKKIILIYKLVFILDLYINNYKN